MSKFDICFFKQPLRILLRQIFLSTALLNMNVSSRQYPASVLEYFICQNGIVSTTSYDCITKENIQFIYEFDSLKYVKTTEERI